MSRTHGNDVTPASVRNFSPASTAHGKLIFGSAFATSSPVAVVTPMTSILPANTRCNSLIGAIHFLHAALFGDHTLTKVNLPCKSGSPPTQFVKLKSGAFWPSGDLSPTASPNPA